MKLRKIQRYRSEIIEINNIYHFDEMITNYRDLYDSDIYALSWKDRNNNTCKDGIFYQSFIPSKFGEQQKFYCITNDEKKYKAFKRYLKIQNKLYKLQSKS